MANNKQQQKTKNWNEDSFMDEFLGPIAHTIAEERLAEKQATGSMMVPKEVYLKQQESEVIKMMKEQFSSLEPIFNLLGEVLREHLHLLPVHQRQKVEGEMESAFVNMYERMEKNEAKNFQEALGISADTALWIYQVGRHCLEKQQYKEGIAVFSFLTMLNNFVADYWLGLGISQKNNGEGNEALYSFAMASLLNPEQPISRYHSADIYHNLGQTEDAKFELEQLTQIVAKMQDKNWTALTAALRNKIQMARRAS